MTDRRNEGEVDVKSDAGFRSVPLVGHLRELIIEHGLATRRGGDDLVFGRTAREPFIPSTTRRRARKAWADANALAAEQAQREGGDLKPRELLGPLSPHEARHCAASYLIAAGLNAKQLSVYFGHSDIRTTYNVYGKLMPDDGQRAVAQLDAFFAEASERT